VKTLDVWQEALFALKPRIHRHRLLYLYHISRPAVKKNQPHTQHQPPRPTCPRIDRRADKKARSGVERSCHEIRHPKILLDGKTADMVQMGPLEFVNLLIGEEQESCGLF